VLYASTGCWFLRPGAFCTAHSQGGGGGAAVDQTQVVPEAALVLSQAAAAETPTTPFVQRVLQASTVGRTLVTSECGAMGVALGEVGAAATLHDGATGAGRFVRESIAAAAAADDDSAGAPLTLLMCLPAEATGAEEAAAAAAVDAALRESSLRYVAVLTAEPPMSSLAASHSRQLLLWPFTEVKAGPPLDSLFFLQLDLLRAFMVVIFSVIALLSGLCCMMAVRFPLSFPPARGVCVFWRIHSSLCSLVEWFGARRSWTPRLSSRRRASGPTRPLARTVTMTHTSLECNDKL
jgi:hypothetical protein